MQSEITVTSYDIIDDVIIYDDGTIHWEAKFYFNFDRMEFRIYDLYKGSLTEKEIAILLEEFFIYNDVICKCYIPKGQKIYIEDLSLLVNGYNVSKNGYNILTYYITEIDNVEDENIVLKKVRDTFKYIMKKTDILGKETITILFKGKIKYFFKFCYYLMVVLEEYQSFKDIDIEYKVKIRLHNHFLYLIPSKSD